MCIVQYKYECFEVLVVPAALMAVVGAYAFAIVIKGGFKSALLASWLL